MGIAELMPCKQTFPENTPKWCSVPQGLRIWVVTPCEVMRPNANLKKILATTEKNNFWMCYPNVVRNKMHRYWRDGSVDKSIYQVSLGICFQDPKLTWKTACGGTRLQFQQSYDDIGGRDRRSWWTIIPITWTTQIGPESRNPASTRWREKNQLPKVVLDPENLY